MFAEINAAYRPSEDEPFMNDKQREYFWRKLVAWRDELLQHSLDTFVHLRQDSAREADPLDNAALEDEMSVEVCARDRESKLLVKIEDALQRLEKGTYGYCEETGEPISLKRLEARMVATLSLAAQEAKESELFQKGIQRI